MPILGVVASSISPVVGAYEFIASGSATGSSQEVSFNTIPSTYKHLILRGYGMANYPGPQDGAFGMRINGTTGSSYSRQGYAAFSTNFSAYDLVGTPFAQVGEVPLNSSVLSFVGSATIYLLEYNDTTFFRTTRANNGFRWTTGASNGGVMNGFGYYDLNKNAVTSLSVYQQNGNWFSNTKWFLYGVKG